MPGHFQPEGLHMPQNPEGPSCLPSLGSTSNIAAFMPVPQTHTNAPQRPKKTKEDLLMRQLKLQTSLEMA